MAITNVGSLFTLGTFTGINTVNQRLFRVDTFGNGVNFIVTDIVTSNLNAGNVDLALNANYLYPAFSGVQPVYSGNLTLATLPSVPQSSFPDFSVNGVASRTNGGYVMDIRTTNNTVTLKFVTSTGAIDHTYNLTTAVNHQAFSQGVQRLANGNYLVVYTDADVTGGALVDADVYSQVVDGNGVAVGGPTLINASGVNINGGGDMIALGSGFATVYQVGTSPAGDFVPSQIRVRLMDANGAPTGADVLVGTVTAGTIDSESRAVSLSTGGLVVFWLEKTAGPNGVAPVGFTQSWAVKSAFVGPTGTVSATTTVTSGSWTQGAGGPTGTNVPFFDVIDLANGGAAVIVTQFQPFSGSPSATAYKYSAAGTLLATDLIPGLFAGYQLGEGGIILGVNSTGNGVSGTLNGQYLDFQQNSINGTNAAETLYGDIAVDDTIFANGGDDTLKGLSGFDVLRGGLGNDTIDGGADDDTADYSTATAAVTLMLTDTANGNGDLLGTATGADGADSLISIERLRGSSSADTITGNSLGNILRGNLGDDTIDGAGGTNDWADYANAATAVTVTLTDIVNGLGKVTGSSSGAAGNDTLLDIEYVMGGAAGDTLTGNSQNNWLRGNGGDDTLNGGAGADTVDYRSASAGVTVTLTDTVNGAGAKLGSSSGADGNDSLISMERISGSRFTDTLTGNSENNLFYGRLGDDTIIGGAGSDTSSYNFSSGAVVVTLTDTTSANGFTGTATGGEGADQLFSIENVFGSDYDDTLTGNSQNNFLLGGLGNDTLNGGADTLGGAAGGTGDWADYRSASGAVQVTLTDALTLNGPTGGTSTGADGVDTISNVENIRGGDFADTLTGNAGANNFRGALGNDTIDGGAGIDNASYSDASGAVVVTLTDAVSGHTGGSSSGADGVDVLIDIENISGSDFGDTLTGNVANNVLNGHLGNDTLNGGAGVDTASYANADASIQAILTDGSGGHAGGSSSGSDGDDALTDIENLSGSDFADILTGNSGANVLSGRDGTDTLNGGDGNDTLIGGVANAGQYNILNGGNGIDTSSYAGVTANVYADLNSGGGFIAGVLTDLMSSIENVIAGDGGSTLNGNALANRFTGGAGDDLIFGQDGNDTLLGGGHAALSFNQLFGGNGIDTVDYSAETGKVFVDLRAPAGHIDNGLGGGFVLNDLMNSVENVLGGSNDDILVGTDADNNLLVGAAGTDLLFGFDGNDTLVGGSANAGQYNLLFGGNGSDTASYVGTTNGVYVDLNQLAGYVKDGGGVFVLTDVYNFVENVTGGSAVDQLIGDTGANVIVGGAGADLLYGNLGAADSSIDRFVYTSAGDSNLTSGYDTLINFVTGQDKIDFTAFGITSAQATVASGGGSTVVYANIDGIAGDDVALVVIGTAVMSDILF